jgi:hypothetical protein
MTASPPCPLCGLKLWDADDLVPGDSVCVCGDPFFDRERPHAVVEAALRYVNCSDSEAETGEPYDELVQAVRAYEQAIHAHRRNS